MSRYRYFVAVLSGATALVAIGAVASAQRWENSLTTASVQRNLNLQEPLFNATIDEPPTASRIDAGRLVAMGGSEKGGAGMACFSCHGASGAGDGSGAVPRLTGLPAWYMYKQLNDYASGRRQNAVMTGIAKKLTDTERRTVSQYYAVVDAAFPSFPDYDGRELQWGQRLAAVGSAQKGIPACTNCHGAYGSGMPPSVPYLAGQYADYITLQLQLWQEGVRANDSMDVMAAIAKQMTIEDMKAVARYYEKVRPLEAKPRGEQRQRRSDAERAPSQ